MATLVAHDKSAVPDLEKLEAAANDTSSRIGGLWLSFLTFMAYLTLTVGSVTHVMLFRESPIRLPVLNISLPLVAFFWIAPILFVLFHFYLLLQISITVRKISVFSKLVDESSLPAEQRDRIRGELSSFLIVQFLFGDSEERTGVTSLFLRFIAIVTLVCAPVILLTQFQLTFLPYHHPVVTWMHRLIILVDLGLIWTFWFAIRHGNGILRFPTWEGLSLDPIKKRILFLCRSRRVATLSSAVVIVFSLFIFAYPGEFISPEIQGLCGGQAISSCFLGGPIDMVRGTPRTFFSNVLVLPNQNLVAGVSGAKPAGESGKNIATLSMRGRNLRGALLIRSNLYGVDFTGANLNHARLDYAILTHASFPCAFPPGSPVKKGKWPYDECTWLQGASLYNAHLEETDFRGAKMQAAYLKTAILHGANLANAQLQMAVLTDAQLQGARLDGAILHGASLVGANLIGAILDNAELQGADLTNATLQLASLKNTVLTGAGMADVKGTMGDSQGGDAERPPSMMFANLDSSEMSCRVEDLSPWKRLRDRIIGQMPKEYGPNMSITAGSEKLQRFNYNKWMDLRESAKNDEAKSNKDMLKAVEGSPSYKIFAARSATANFVAQLLCAPGSSPYITRALINNARVLAAGEDFYIGLQTTLADKQCKGATSVDLTDFQMLQHVYRMPPPPPEKHKCADGAKAAISVLTKSRVAHKRN